MHCPNESCAVQIQTPLTEEIHEVNEVHVFCPHCQTQFYICENCCELNLEKNQTSSTYCENCGYCNIKDASLRKKLELKDDCLQRICQVQLQINEVAYVQKKVSEYQQLTANNKEIEKLNDTAKAKLRIIKEQIEFVSVRKGFSQNGANAKSFDEHELFLMFTTPHFNVCAIHVLYCTTKH